MKPEGGPQCTDEDECYLGTYNCDENADCINNPVSSKYVPTVLNAIL